MTITQANTNQTTEVYESLIQTQQQQTTFSDERATAVETGYINNTKPVLPVQNRHMAEDQYTIMNMLQQPIKYKSFEWFNFILNPRNFQIDTISVPNVFTTLSSIHKLQLQVFSFFKFTLKIKFQLNSTKFNCGKLMIVWDPLGQMSAPATGAALTPNHSYHLVQCSGYPNVILDAKESQVAEMEIPWEHVLSCFSASLNPASSDLPLGVIRLIVLNPLQTPTDAPASVGLTTWISCGDLSLNVPTRPHNINYSLESSTSGLISDVMTGNFSGALNKASSGVRSLFKDFNLDKPSIADIKTSNCLATVSPQAHMKGADSSVRLGAAPACGYLEQDFTQAPNSELLIHEIIQRPMLVGTKIWSVNDNIDTLLMEIPIDCRMLTTFDKAANPWVLNNTEALPGPYSGLPYRWYPTYLGFMSTMFEFYSGSIDIRLDFASTSFHTGRLQISFEPTITPDPLDDTINSANFSNCPNQIFDLHECSTTSFKINYVAQTPRKRRGDFFKLDDNSMLGMLRIIVVNPLVSPATLTDNIEFNMYVSAGEDFRFSVPCITSRIAIASDQSSLPPTGTTLEALVDDVATRTDDKNTYPGLLRGGKLIPNNDVFNENVDSVLDLARRYSLIGEVTTTFAASPVGDTDMVLRSVYSIVVTPGVNNAFRNDVDNVLESRTWDAHCFYKMVSQMYVFWSGSMRYQILPYYDRTMPMQIKAIFAPNVYMLPSSDATEFRLSNLNNAGIYNSSYPTFYINTSQDVGLQIEVPFYSKFNQCAINQVTLTGDNDDTTDPFFSGSIMIESTCPNKTDVKADTMFATHKVLASIGDDFKFRYLIAPPALIYYTFPPI